MYIFDGAWCNAAISAVVRSDHVVGMFQHGISKRRPHRVQVGLVWADQHLQDTPCSALTQHVCDLNVTVDGNDVVARIDRFAGVTLLVPSGEKAATFYVHDLEAITVSETCNVHAQLLSAIFFSQAERECAAAECRR